MASIPRISSATFKRLRQLDTCTASNAIERLKVRLRNEGSVSGSAVRCQFPDFPPMLGYAVTGRIRTTSVPVAGRAYHENMSWWRYVASFPAPRVMVLEDVDDDPGAGGLGR